VGVRADDGKYLWGYNRVANGTANIPTPIPDGDFVFCSSGYGTGAGLVKLSKDGDGVKAEEVYFLGGKEFQNHHGGMIKLGKHIYAGHGNNQGFPTCLEMETGKVAWQHLERNEPGSGSAAIVYAEDRLYFRYQDGTMALLDASPEGFKLRGKFKIPGAGGDSWAHPVVLHGKLFLREHDNLFVYDIARKDGN
jgi:outer membrane protein assembly factor BamB